MREHPPEGLTGRPTYRENAYHKKGSQTMNGISRDTFEGMDVASKLNVLYDCAIQSHTTQTDTRNKVETLEKKFDRRKKIDTGIAGVAGLIGGFLAHFSEYFMRGKSL